MLSSKKKNGKNPLKKYHMHFFLTKLPTLKKDQLSQAAEACLLDNKGSCEHITHMDSQLPVLQAFSLTKHRIQVNISVAT